MKELTRKKPNIFMMLITLPLVVPTVLLGWIAGYLYGFLYGGFKSGENYVAKVSGLETNEEIINRVINEKLNQPTE